MKYIVNILIAIFLSLGLYAQDVRVTAVLDTNILLIGDQTTLHIELTQPKSKKVYWPKFTEKLGEHVDILNISDFDTIQNNNSNEITIKADLLISTFDTGYVAIPPLAFIYDVENDSIFKKVETPALLMGIATLKVDMEKGITDIKPILEVPITWRDYILYIIIGLVAIILIILGIYVYKKIKNKEPIFVLPKKPSIPPHIIARQELDSLSNKKLWQNNEFKEYYSCLTDIVRTYMDGIWNIGAMEMVSDDIIENLKKQNISKELRETTEQVLRTADFVKFAKTKPLGDENASALKWAYDFVNQTMKKEEDVNSDTKDTKDNLENKNNTEINSSNNENEERKELKL